MHHMVVLSFENVDLSVFCGLWRNGIDNVLQFFYFHQGGFLLFFINILLEWLAPFFGLAVVEGI
jgi:hypothetical protein